MDERKLLEIKNLHVEYRTDDAVIYAVNGLNLTLNKGETIGLVGETGAGKTTTALGILNLIANPPGVVTEGEIFFKGENILKADKKRLHHLRGNQISMIFQDPMTSLNPVYSVGNQVAESILRHTKCSKSEAHKRAEEMLQTVGISKDRYHEYPHQFSGGMKQRVVIAMSLSCEPELILADEPTTALDVTIQAQVLELMSQLKHTMNTSMLLITHDLGVVAQICDRVAIMYAGEIIESGSVEEVFAHPSHPYTIGLFNSIPTLTGTEKTLKPIPGHMPDSINVPDGCTFFPRCAYGCTLCESERPQMSCVSGTQEVRCFVLEGKVASAELMEAVRHGR